MKQTYLFENYLATKEGIYFTISRHGYYEPTYDCPTAFADYLEDLNSSISDDFFSDMEYIDGLFC